MTTTTTTLYRLTQILNNHIDLTKENSLNDMLVEKYCDYTVDLAKDYETENHVEQSNN